MESFWMGTFFHLDALQSTAELSKATREMWI